MFNRRLEYMGCSDYASDVFTELKDNEVGRPLKKTGCIGTIIRESTASKRTRAFMI